MGTHALYVRFPDGTIRHGAYASASDLACPELFDSPEAVEASGCRHATAYDPTLDGSGEPVDVATVYGGGFCWNATATRDWLTSNWDPFDPFVHMTAGHPVWLADHFAFAPRTPEQWCERYDLDIRDPDGWRTKDAPPWDQPIGLPEFWERFNQCAVRDLHLVDYDRIVADVRAAREAS